MPVNVVVVFLTPGEDGWIVARCPSIPGCVSQGRTEAVNNYSLRSSADELANICRVGHVEDLDPRLDGPRQVQTNSYLPAAGLLRFGPGGQP